MVFLLSNSESQFFTFVYAATVPLACGKSYEMP